MNTQRMRTQFHLWLAVAVGLCIVAPMVDAFPGAIRAFSPFRNLWSKVWNRRLPSLPIRAADRLGLRGRVGSGSLSSVATATAPAPSAPVEKFRKDYKAPDYSIRTVDLTFKIFKGHTQVRPAVASDPSCELHTISLGGRCFRRLKSQGALMSHRAHHFAWTRKTLLSTRSW